MTWGDGIDWNAEGRRAATDSVSGAAGDLLKKIVEHIGDLPRTVVDCGCNIGKFYPQFAAAGFHYTGVDQAQEALATAKARYPGVPFIESFLWADWPSSVGPQTAAFCNAVLQHNRNERKPAILQRIAQAVIPGGLFAMQESVVMESTSTQLRQADWVALVENAGFDLLTTWHPNDEFNINDAFLFRRREHRDGRTP